MKGVPLNRSSCFSRRHSSKPSISGIFVSERMRSGGEISHLSRASRPFTAVVTEKPAFLSETSITRSDFGSPSTRSRCCFAKPSPFRASLLTGASLDHAREPGFRQLSSVPLLAAPPLEDPQLAHRVRVARVGLLGRAEVALGPRMVPVFARDDPRDVEGAVAARVLRRLRDERPRPVAVLARGIEDERPRERRLIVGARVRPES